MEESSARIPRSQPTTTPSMAPPSGTFSFQVPAQQGNQPSGTRPVQQGNQQAQALPVQQSSQQAQARPVQQAYQQQAQARPAQQANQQPQAAPVQQPVYQQPQARPAQPTYQQAPRVVTQAPNPNLPSLQDAIHLVYTGVLVLEQRTREECAVSINRMEAQNAIILAQQEEILRLRTEAMSRDQLKTDSRELELDYMRDNSRRQRRIVNLLSALVILWVLYLGHRGLGNLASLWSRLAA